MPADSAPDECMKAQNVSDSQLLSHFASRWLNLARPSLDREEITLPGGRWRRADQDLREA